GRVGEIVDRHHLDVGLALRALGLDGAEEVAADAAESVDAYPDSHSSLLTWPCGAPTASLRPCSSSVGLRGPARRGAQGTIFAVPRKPSRSAGADPFHHEAPFMPHRAVPGSPRTRCPGSPVARPCGPPSTAAGGCARPPRPWSSPAGRAGRVPPART